MRAIILAVALLPFCAFAQTVELKFPANLSSIDAGGNFTIWFFGSGSVFVCQHFPGYIDSLNTTGGLVDGTDGDYLLSLPFAPTGFIYMDFNGYRQEGPDHGMTDCSGNPLLLNFAVNGVYLPSSSVTVTNYVTTTVTNGVFALVGEGAVNVVNTSSNAVPSEVITTSDNYDWFWSGVTMGFAWGGIAFSFRLVRQTGNARNGEPQI